LSGFPHIKTNSSLSYVLNFVATTYIARKKKILL